MSRGHHPTQGVAKEIMVERYKSKLAFRITQGIHKKLFKCPKPKSRKLVMKKVITNPTLESYLPNYFITKKLVITIQELVVGCMFL
jgi:hypothetical protein